MRAKSQCSFWRRPVCCVTAFSRLQPGFLVIVIVVSQPSAAFIRVFWLLWLLCHSPRPPSSGFSGYCYCVTALVRLHPGLLVIVIVSQPSATFSRGFWLLLFCVDWGLALITNGHLQWEWKSTSFVLSVFNFSLRAVFWNGLKLSRHHVCTICCLNGVEDWHGSVAEAENHVTSRRNNQYI